MFLFPSNKYIPTEKHIYKLYSHTNSTMKLFKCVRLQAKINKKWNKEFNFYFIFFICLNTTKNKNTCFKQQQTPVLSNVGQNLPLNRWRHGTLTCRQLYDLDAKKKMMVKEIFFFFGFISARILVREKKNKNYACKSETMIKRLGVWGVMR